MAALVQKMKNLRSELQEHRVNAVEGNPRTVDPNQKERQNATRFCNYCRTNGHTPSWCRKKIRDEELKRIENERTTERKVTITQEYNKERGPDHALEQWTRGQDFQRRNPNYNNDRPTRNYPTPCQNFSPKTSRMGIPIRTMENHMINDKISHSVEAMKIDPKKDLSTIRMGTGETMGTSFALNRLKKGDYSQNSSYRQFRSD